MGWSFTNGATRADIINRLTRARTHSDGETWTTLARCLRGNTLYYVVEIKKPGAEPKRHICISLLGSDRGFGWGSKDLTESSGPFNYACPLSYLDMVPDPGGCATEWRAGVRAYHAGRKARRERWAEWKRTVGSTPA